MPGGQASKKEPADMVPARTAQVSVLECPARGTKRPSHRVRHITGLGTLREEGRKKMQSQTLLASQTGGSGKMISDSGFQPPRNGAFKRGLGKFPSQPLSQHILVDVLTQRAPTFVASGAGDPVRV